MENEDSKPPKRTKVLDTAMKVAILITNLMTIFGLR